MKCTYCTIQDEELHWPINVTTGHHEPVCAGCLQKAPPGTFATTEIAAA